MTSLRRRIRENGFMDEGSIDIHEKRLVLAYEELNEVPPSIIEKYANRVDVLDLSHNNIRRLEFLVHFGSMTTLILDHNKLTSASHFPGLLNLTTLWINNNCITDLRSFVPRLARSLPNLRFLSLMKNPATPSSFGPEPFAQYSMYRSYVIANFPTLQHLDEQMVTPSERQEAAKHFKYLQLLSFILPTTPKFPLVRDNKIV